MFTILNRLRGTYSWFAKVNAVILGVLLYLVLDNPYISVLSSLGYLLGESMGWGDWIGQLASGKNKCGKEGSKNGIKWITSKLFLCGSNNYNKMALFIRGLYWWIPVLLPIVFVLDPFIVVFCALLLGASFPLSVILSTKIDISPQKRWEYSEIIYGFFQDLFLLIMFLWGCYGTAI